MILNINDAVGGKSVEDFATGSLNHKAGLYDLIKPQQTPVTSCRAFQEWSLKFIEYMLVNLRIFSGGMTVCVTVSVPTDTQVRNK